MIFNSLKQKERPSRGRSAFVLHKLTHFPAKSKFTIFSTFVKHNDLLHNFAIYHPQKHN